MAIAQMETSKLFALDNQMGNTFYVIICMLTKER